MKQIKVGIIGQGRSGYAIHSASLKLVSDKFKVVAVADPLEERCDDSVADWGCDAYTDYKEMLKRNDLDLVVNATPSHLHVPVSLEVMDAGFNLLCEKPLARRTEEVDRLIEKSQETGKFFAIYQQSRFAPYFQQVKKVINSGVLGRIVMIKVAFNGFARRWDWQTLQEYNGGGLLNTGPHPLDQALNLFSPDAMPEIFCVMDRANITGDAEDHVKLLLRGAGRPTIDLEVSSCCAYPLYTYQVYGTQGGLTGDMDHMEWKYFKPAEATELTLVREPLPNRVYCSEELKWYTESWDYEGDLGLFKDTAKSFYDNLYDALVDGSPLEVTPAEVRRLTAVIEECHRQNPLPRLEPGSD